MKKIITLFIGLIPIGIIRKLFLNLIGHKVSYKSKLGLNILYINYIKLEEGSRVGNFNLIASKSLHLETDSFIKRLNYFKGPFKVYLSHKSGISNSNKFRRANYPISAGEASLYLGKNSFIVSNHFIDLTRSVSFGDNSILAGINTQLWTHGYYHANEGPDRIRIDGDIEIGNNVYVGSRCLFNPGVKVRDAIHIGAGSVISKNLEQSGMYVSQELRYLKNDINTIKEKLHRVQDNGLVEHVYSK